MEEKDKKTKIEEELSFKDRKLRKINSENDSLTFRNEQLVKRVETLQTSIASNNAAFVNSNNKKVK